MTDAKDARIAALETALAEARDALVRLSAETAELAMFAKSFNEGITRDAARYHWLRDSWDREGLESFGDYKKFYDAAIDGAMADTHAAASALAARNSNEGTA